MLNKFKKALETEKEQIQLRAQIDKEQEWDPGSDDVDRVQTRILALASSQLLARDQEKLRRIDIALKRIQEGTFGICGSCSDPISEKRLMINPIYTLCISCAEYREIAKNRK